MRASIAYLTSTATTVPAAQLQHGGHRLDVLGYHRGARTVYLREEVGAPLPIVFAVRTRGEHAGKMVAMRSWYEGPQEGALLEPRLTELASELTPMEEIEPDAWTLTTRVIQRRALKLPEGGRPIRKYAVQLTVEPVIMSDEPVLGRTVVTAYLRPRAHLERVWAIPGEPLALARVTYVGVPEGVGLDKQVALLVGRDLH